MALQEAEKRLKRILLQHEVDKSAAGDMNMRLEEINRVLHATEAEYAALQGEHRKQCEDLDTLARQNQVRSLAAISIRVWKKFF